MDVVNDTYHTRLVENRLIWFDTLMYIEAPIDVMENASYVSFKSPQELRIAFKCITC